MRSAMDPLQSSCKVVGVRDVAADGNVEFEAKDVVMPWDRIKEVLGAPGEDMRWHMCLVHDQHRMKGALYRLLRNGCDPIWHVCCA